MNFHVVGKTPVRSRIGNFILSRTAQVNRAMVVKVWNTPDRPFPVEKIQQVVNNGKGDVLFALSNNYLPAELTACVEAAGLTEDVGANAEQVVFCTQVATANDGPSRQSQGFIIEGRAVTDTPYEFAEGELAEMTGQQFIPAPEKTVFLNANYWFDSFAAASLGHFPTLAYFLAYKRASVEIENLGIDPQLARHTFRAMYARINQLRAINGLQGLLIPGQKLALGQAELRPLAAQIERGIRSAYSRLDQRDVRLINKIDLLERI
jgi:hypothetical protein